LTDNSNYDTLKKFREGGNSKIRRMLVPHKQMLPCEYAGERVIAALDPVSLLRGLRRLARTFPGIGIHPDSSFGREHGLELGLIFLTVPCLPE